jgi:enoyl-CoA hydratase/carnithine racemase
VERSVSVVARNFASRVSNGVDRDGQSPHEVNATGLKSFSWASQALVADWVEALQTLIVTKSSQGFDRSCVNDLTRLLAAISCGEISGLKYLVFDFAHCRDGDATGSEGFEELVVANAELILRAPVITVAWARSLLAGADFEFATHCSMLVAEKDALFSFDGEPATLFGLYSSLARKIGFVKTQRLIEEGAILGAQDMRNLLLAKDVVEPENGLAAIRGFVRQCGRRYNATYSIFRAQRSVMKSIGPRQETRVRA